MGENLEVGVAGLPPGRHFVDCLSSKYIIVNGIIPHCNNNEPCLSRVEEICIHPNATEYAKKVALEKSIRERGERISAILNSPSTHPTPDERASRYQKCQT